jgi:hypothetical protein
MSFHSKIEKPRARRRAQVFLSGLLSTPAGAIKVRIRDVSEAGAQVVGEQQIPSQCRVQLQRGEMHVFAQVAWASGKAAGLSFERPLTVTELERCMPLAVVRALDVDSD